jgi:predicted AlkP superfamily pyrophosphatase or phosphodiesterase
MTAWVLAYALTASPAAIAIDAPEPPPGDAVDGDVSTGSEAAGLNASEWEAAMTGSSTSANPRGAVEALLENPFTDLVYFYKNLNGSLEADEDDAYHVFARRCSASGVLTEDCDDADVVFDHLVFTRTAATDGSYTFDVVSLTPERPVGTVLGSVVPVNPFGQPSAPGPVTVIDANDPRRDPGALDDLASEIAAASRSTTETEPDSEIGVVRHFIPPEHATYPYPYERLAAELDDADSGDIMVNPTPSGDEGDVRGGHGALDVTQSRATLLVSGRGARRPALDPLTELAMETKHVDIAPTVASVLGVSTNSVARYLNNGDAAANPDAEPALLLRQDGKVLADLLEPKVNTFVVVIDGMIPENVNATETPNICNLTNCPGAVAPDATAHATVYEEARATMIAQTNANHTAMLTGAYGEDHGIIANKFWDRSAAAEVDAESPAFIMVDTIFDVLRREAPQLKTAAVLGKEKLRLLYDCTMVGGECAEDVTANPEGAAVTHVRPDFLRGAATSPEPGTDDCLAEPVSGSGVAVDSCIMDAVIRLSATEDPDFTFVNLGTVDGLQHVDGPNSPAALAAVAQADQQVGRLVDYLKESGKWQDSVVMIVADHSFSFQGPPPLNRVDLESLFSGDATITGTGEGFAIVSNGGTADVYLTGVDVNDASLTAPQEVALDRMRELALAQTGVVEAWYRLENSLDPGQTLAANRADWHLDDQRAGDLVVTALASGPETGLLNPLGTGTGPYEVASGAGYTLAAPASTSGVLPGDHGHPGTRHIPFIVIGGGDYVVDQTVAATGTVNEGYDSGGNPGQAENVDVAPTVAWIYGLDPGVAMPDATGRALTEAFSARPIETIAPHANRAIIFVFDANNSVRVHDLMADCLRQPDDSFACGNAANVPADAIRSLLFHDSDGRIDVPQGTLTRFGSIAAFPSVTFPNHNVVGSGVYPGHHGIVGNRYYERDIETERDPIDPNDPRNPLFFFSSQLLRLDFETLHEAVHRAFGNWASSPEDPMCDPDVEPCNGPSGAFTASINEPSARGANFASLETLSSSNFPATFAFLTANAPDFVADTDLDCSQQSPTGYGQESVLDHLGQAQGRALFSEASTSGLPSIPGVGVQTSDTTGGAAHPDPKYMIENFTLTDGAGHEFGPHGNCTRKGWGNTSSRLGRVLTELANHDRFATTGEPARLGETFIVLTGDHGMENQNREGKDFGSGVFFGELGDADIEFIWQDRSIYLLTLHAEVLEADVNGYLPPGLDTLTFRITDDDIDETGARRPVEGASVEAQSGVETLSGTTNAAGEVTFTFANPVTAVSLKADHDANPTNGMRTIGSESMVPTEHGIVEKSDYNELATTFTVPPFGVCTGAPISGCRQPGLSKLVIKDKAGTTKDSVSWRWGKGAATTAQSFGNPTVDTGYMFCAYDTATGLLDVAAPSGANWTPRSTGFRYKDNGAATGMRLLDLKTNSANSGRIRVQARGANVGVPDLPLLQLPVKVQLVSSEGECWEATYATLVRNDDRHVVAR